MDPQFPSCRYWGSSDGWWISLGLGGGTGNAFTVTNRVLLGWGPAHGANHLWLRRVAEPGKRRRQLWPLDERPQHTPMQELLQNPSLNRPHGKKPRLTGRERTARNPIKKSGSSHGAELKPCLPVLRVRHGAAAWRAFIPSNVLLA